MECKKQLTVRLELVSVCVKDGLQHTRVLISP